MHEKKSYSSMWSPTKAEFNLIFGEYVLNAQKHGNPRLNVRTASDSSSITCHDVSGDYSTYGLENQPPFQYLWNLE